MMKRKNSKPSKPDVRRRTKRIEIITPDQLKPLDLERYLREKEVLTIFPISRSAWWAGIRSGKYPKPKKLGPNTTAWRVSSIRKLIDEINGTK